MEGVDKDVEPSLSAVRRHVMHDFFSRREEQDDSPSQGGLRRPQLERPSQVRKNIPGNSSPLACPFAKFDPLRYGKCYRFALEGVSQVMQHLERVHSIPIHCPNCYLHFDNNIKARDRHVRDGTCHTAPDRRLEGVSESTMKMIRCRLPSDSIQENWYSIFALLFPKEGKPQSPYIMDLGCSAMHRVDTPDLDPSTGPTDFRMSPTLTTYPATYATDERSFPNNYSRSEAYETALLDALISALVLSQKRSYSSDQALSLDDLVDSIESMILTTLREQHQLSEEQYHSSNSAEILSTPQLLQLALASMMFSNHVSGEEHFGENDKKTRRVQPVEKEHHPNGTVHGQSRYPIVPITHGGSGDSAADTVDQLQTQTTMLLGYNKAIYHESVEGDRGGGGRERFADPPISEISMILCDTDSLISPAESMDDLDDHLLNIAVSQLRSSLLEKSKSDSFCRDLQHRSAYGRCASSTPQEQSTDSTPESTSKSSSSSYSLSPSSATTCGTSNGGKRRRDKQSGQDEQQHKKGRLTQDESECKPTPRLACLFNKYDPMMYRSNLQTDKKFEICGMHDFQNMNKLYEHLKRVHSDQPLQCPRCTRTNFASLEELQEHHAALEACTSVPLDAVKRIQWITHDKRLALQSAVSRRLRGCTDEEKWRFAYRWLFPDTDPDETPCPYLQDPVISIVSSVVDDFEIRLREMIRSSDDLDDLANRIPIIRGQFLARYGIVVDEVEQDLPSLASLRTVSSSPASGGINTITPPDVTDPDQPHLGGDTDHEELSLASNPQPDPNVPPPDISAQQNDVPEPQLAMSSELFREFADFDNGMLSWDSSEIWSSDHVTTNDIRNSLYAIESSKDLHGSGALVQQESLNCS